VGCLGGLLKELHQKPHARPPFRRKGKCELGTLPHQAITTERGSAHILQRDGAVSSARGESKINIAVIPGTEGSNPCCSSGESSANLIFADVSHR
jgi:hypothetical protein